MKRNILIVVISVLAIVTIAKAATIKITPPTGAPVATLYSLSEIYNFITGNTPATEGSPALDFSSALEDTGNTLADIYDALASLVSPASVSFGTTYLGAAGTYNTRNLAVGTVKNGTAFGVGLTGEYPSATYKLPGDTAATDAAAATICNGTEAWTSSGTLLTGTFNPAAASISVGDTFCGTAGTLLGNLFNGTGTSEGIVGGSQAAGGVDDYNGGSDRPANAYAKGWTSCTSGADNYCGTGDPFADMKDNSTGLIWSKPCNGSGCATSAEPAVTTYSWDNSAVNNNSLTASVLCSQDLGTTHDSGWFLPHQKQLMQAYIDGAYGNLEASGVNASYWSATRYSGDSSVAWRIKLSSGGTYYYDVTGTFSVRCVR